MTIAQTDEPTLQKPLRLWPGVVIVVLQWLFRFVVPIVVPDAEFFGAIGGVFGGLAIIVWWAFFSRAARSERWGAVVLMIVALVATSRVLHESVATAAMGIGFYVYAIPVLCLAFVVWAVAARHLPDGLRRAAMVATILLACGAWALVRTGGSGGFGGSDFAWRWSQTPEEWLLAQGDDEPGGAPAGCGRHGDRGRGAGSPTGPAFADRIATASSPASRSRPTGRRRRRSSCGAGRSDRAGRPSRSTATSSTPRSSAVTTRSSPATTRAPASRCGDIVTRPGSGSRMPAPVRAPRRPSAMAASTHSVRPES